MRNNKNPNELELLEAAVAGDNDAFGKLIVPYARESIAPVTPWTSCLIEKGIKTLVDSGQLVFLTA